MNRQRRVQFCGRRRVNEAAYSGSVDLMNGMGANGVANLLFGKMRMQPVASLQNPPAHENKIEQVSKSFAICKECVLKFGRCSVQDKILLCVI